MDIQDIYYKKTALTENIKDITLKDLFQSEENINLLTSILYNNNFLPNNSNIYNSINKIVINYVKSWINLGKFDNLSDKYNNTEYVYIQLRYYNKVFIDTFNNEIVNGDMLQHEIDNNPYKHKFITSNEEKTISEIQTEDFQYITFNNYNDKFNVNSQFKRLDNQIPEYEKWIYNKHYDRNDLGSLTNKALENYNYKKYNNDELLNNVSYLKK